MNKMDGYAPKNANSISDIVSNKSELSILSLLLSKVIFNGNPIGQALDSLGEFTLFAPNNQAFKEAEKKLKEKGLLAKSAKLKDKLDDPATNKLLSDILLYHTLGNVVMSSAINDGATPRTLNGKNLCINILGGKVYINARAKVTKADIKATNGVIHVLDSVLLPVDNCTPDELMSKGGKSSRMKKDAKPNKKAKMN